MTTTTAVKERPILFSGEMVRAILAGAKTQTRRAVGPGNCAFGSASKEFFKHCDFNDAFVDPGGTIFGPGPYLKIADHKDADCERCKEMGWGETRHRLYPRWEIGDVLWVRETWQQSRVRRRDLERFCVRTPAPGIGDIHYAATCDGDEPPKWRPSIFMPRWASRITLEITELRAQRLQDISEYDAKAEGASPEFEVDVATFVHRKAFDYEKASTHKLGFKHLWNAINGKGSWESNPWVWAITFKKLCV